MTALLRLRVIWLAFVFGILIVADVVAAVVPEDGTGSARLAAVFAMISGASSIALPRFVSLTLDCESDASLSTSYLKVFLFRLASAEAPFLVSLGGAVWSGEAWVMLGAVPFTAYGFAMVIPTAGNLARQQRTLTAQGCERDLARALRVSVSEAPPS